MIEGIKEKRGKGEGKKKKEIEGELNQQPSPWKDYALPFHHSHSGSFFGYGNFELFFSPPEVSFSEKNFGGKNKSGNPHYA